MIATFLRKGPTWPGATCTAIVTGMSVTKMSNAEMRVRYPSASKIQKITKTAPLSQSNHDGSPIMAITSRHGDSAIRSSI